MPTRSSRRRRTPKPVAPFLRDRVALVALILLAGILLWWLVWQAAGDGGAMLGYLNAFGFWYGVLALLTAVVLGWRRLWPFAGAALLLGIAILTHNEMPVFGKPAVPQGAPHFRLMTASLRNFNNDMTDAARTLLREQPDVMVVQEADIDPLMQALDSQSGAHWNEVHHLHELIACTCAITASSIDRSQLHATVALPGGKVNVWNVRAPKDYSNTALNTAYFADVMSAMLSAGSGIAAGDYNATPWNDGYRSLSSIATDAYRQVNHGPGFTFPTRARHMGIFGPLIALDHVFATSQYVPIDARIVPASSGADHLPMVVDFAIAQPKD